VRILLCGQISSGIAAIGEKIMECRIIYRSDAVAYPFAPRSSTASRNFFWPQFRRRGEPVKPSAAACRIPAAILWWARSIHRRQCEGDDRICDAHALLLHNAARGFGSELANPIENPVSCAPSALERLGRSQDRLEVLSGRCLRSSMTPIEIVTSA